MVAINSSQVPSIAVFALNFSFGVLHGLLKVIALMWITGECTPTKAAGLAIWQAQSILERLLCLQIQPIWPKRKTLYIIHYSEWGNSEHYFMQSGLESKTQVKLERTQKHRDSETDQKAHIQWYLGL